SARASGEGRIVFRRVKAVRAQAARTASAKEWCPRPRRLVRAARRPHRAPALRSPIRSALLAGLLPVPAEAAAESIGDRRRGLALRRDRPIDRLGPDAQSAEARRRRPLVLALLCSRSLGARGACRLALVPHAAHER